MQFLKKVSDILADRQELELKVKKIGNDLVIMAIPDVKGSGKIFNITAPEEDVNGDIDVKFFEVISSGPKEKATFSSTVTDGPEKDEEEDDDAAGKEDAGKKDAGKSKAAGGSKSKSKPKDVSTTPKREETKPEIKKKKSGKNPKTEAPVVTDAQHEKDLAETLQPEETKSEIQPGIDKVNEEMTSQAKQLSADINTGPSAEEELEAKRLAEEKQNAVDSFNTFVTKARNDMNEKKFDKALEAYDMALDIFPDDETVKFEKDLAQKKLDAFNLLNS